MKSLRHRRAGQELEDRRERSQQLMADAEFALEQGNSDEAFRLHEEAKRLDPAPQRLRRKPTAPESAVPAADSRTCAM